MCPFTQVHYKCGHRVYTVRAWCEKYERTHVRCKVFVVAYERRYVRVFIRSSHFAGFVLCLPVVLPSQVSLPSPHSFHFYTSSSLFLFLFLLLPLSTSLLTSLMSASTTNTNIPPAVTLAVPADLPSRHHGWRPSRSPSSPSAVSAVYGASSHHRVPTGRAHHP